MIQYMLDTNICIYIIKRKPAEVIERLKQCQISQVGISSITLSELEYGVARNSKPERNQIALAQFLAPMKILSYGDEAAQQYGLRAFLETQGTPIGSLDMLIAAQRARKGIFTTALNFSKEAQGYISRIETKIILIDGATLARSMIDDNVGVTTLSNYAVKKLHMDYFTEG